ncbi:G patch domain-containing protein 4 [Microplitis mediator]|uniref:G patch domain-containing protein 4 n=1 Tax=Microplitis mediator TaxID=375433 RepID=UPI002555A8D8|nr:G patch domain-containing protein 4 [Microplitis mediator]
MGDFAKSQLEKFGWSEGKGLGKNEDGIVEALRPKLKFDTTGIGHRDTSGNQWWNTVFNKAASNITVDTSSSSKPVFKVNSSIALDIAAAKLNINIGEVKSKDSSLIYGNFVKTCTLQGAKETKSAAQEKRTLDDDKLMFKNFIVDDEKLFKACKGRTAHKGARHGLKLSGKLARIQQQEQELVEQMNLLGDLSDDWTKVKSKSKKLKCHKEKADCDTSIDLGDKSRVEPVVESTVTDLIAQIDADNEDQDQDLELDPDRKVGSRKTRRKMKRKFDELTEILSSSLSLADESPTQSRKVKKKKKDSDCAGEIADPNTDDCKVKSKNKKHKKVTTDSNILNCKINKKKKKKHEKKEKAKLQFISDNFTNLGLEETADDVSKSLVKSAKKKKKKSKK